MIRFKQNILTILGTSILMTGCGPKKETEHKTVDAVTVTIKEVVGTQQPQELSYSGGIEPDNTVSLSFSVPARVINVQVEEGQKIKKGQLLAAVDQSTYHNNYNVASASLEQAQDNFNRLTQLYNKKSLPERDYIAAKVSLAQAKANLANALKNLQDTKLYASFSGIVTQKLIEIGAAAAPGMPAFTIVKTDKVYATASITENEISSLKVGAAAQVSIPSLKKTLNGKIAIINPQADNSSKTYRVKVRLDNARGELLPGMIADLIIQAGTSKSEIIIPADAVVRDADNINYVFTVSANKKAVKKRVNISRMTGANDVVIHDGLQEGDKLIINGQTNLDDGAAVKF